MHTRTHNASISNPTRIHKRNGKKTECALCVVYYFVFMCVLPIFVAFSFTASQQHTVQMSKWQEDENTERQRENKKDDSVLANYMNSNKINGKWQYKKSAKAKKNKTTENQINTLLGQMED